MKRTIRLTESDLHRIIRRAVNEVMAINEYGDTPKGQYMLGRLYQRQNQDKSLSGQNTADNTLNYAYDQRKSQNPNKSYWNNSYDAFTAGMNNQRELQNAQSNVANQGANCARQQSQQDLDQGVQNARNNIAKDYNGFKNGGY